MEDVFDYFIPVAVIFGFLLFFYTFRNAATDVAYLALTHWKHTVFIVTCISVGVFVGAYNAHLGSVLDNYNLHLSLRAQKTDDNERIATAINECKKFVEAKLDGKLSYDEPSPSLGDVIRIGATSYWDTCANTFGMNYWKHDIYIKGEEGGAMLCKAYRNGAYRSGNVENWCATVLAPGEKI